MPEIDFSFLGIFLTICFVLLLVALLIVALPGWVWFVLLLFVVGMFFFGDKNEK
jgi:hypothetical protein